MAFAASATVKQCRPKGTASETYYACLLAHSGCTTDAHVTAETRRVDRARGRARAGRNSITVQAPKRRGRYTLVLSAREADGRVVSDRALLSVRPRRRR